MKTFIQILEVIGILIAVLSVPLFISYQLKPTPMSNNPSITAEAFYSSENSVLGVSDQKNLVTNDSTLSQSILIYIVSGVACISGFYFLKYKLEKDKNGIK